MEYINSKISFADAIKSARVQANLTQSALADLAKVTRLNVANIEAGNNVGSRILEKVMSALNIGLVTLDSRARIQGSIQKTEKQRVRTKGVLVTVEPLKLKTKQNNVVKKLGLSFPYNWSNSQMPDDLLVTKVLERGIFEDVAKVTFQYGFETIKNRIDKSDFAPIVKSELYRMLGNISNAERAVHG